MSFCTPYIAVSCRVGVVVRGHCSACNRLVCGRCWFLCRCFICFWCRLGCWAVCHVGLVPVVRVLRFCVFSCFKVVLFVGGSAFGIVAYAFVVFGFVVAKGGSIIVQCVSLVFKTHLVER